MARVWFLMIVLTALLPACTAQEPQTSIRQWNTMIETREKASAPATTATVAAAENEKESASDCLRKNSVIEAWSCAYKD